MHTKRFLQLFGTRSRADDARQRLRPGGHANTSASASRDSAACRTGRHPGSGADQSARSDQGPGAD